MPGIYANGGAPRRYAGCAKRIFMKHFVGLGLRQLTR
jgi:hypothetical protein